MYRGKIASPTTYAQRPNLKILLSENSALAKQVHSFAFIMQRIEAMDSYKTLNSLKSTIEAWLKTNKLVGAIHAHLSAVPRSLKNQSASVLRIWAHQCECVVAQRLRRGQQMFCLYSKLWDERKFKELIKQMRRRMALRGRDLVLGAVGLTAYDWKTNRIQEDDIKRHLNDLDYTHKLKNNTVCPPCVEADQNKCLCQEKSIQTASYDDWRVFIKERDLIVWRRLHGSSHYEYKVFGSYNDVSAEDFLNVQVDIDYRRKWDTTAVALELVETDPQVATNSDVIYWEMKWPRLFANRDYVFNRRYFVDHSSKTLLIMSKSTVHPSCPERGSLYRIRDYWSIMVVKPYTELDKEGIEFSLTYYDNPGVNIPASVTTWVAMKAMPEFLKRLREATKEYRQYCTTQGVCKVCNIMEQDLSSLDEPDDCPECDLDLFYEEITDNTISEAHYDMEKFKRKRRKRATSRTPPPHEVDRMDDNTPPPPPSQKDDDVPERNSFWKYLRPTYYFS